jgi:sulfatase modifying factor 1
LILSWYIIRVRTFICYSVEDQGFAYWVARYLQKHGGEIVLTRWQTDHPSKAWEQALAYDIGACHKFILILSPAALKSWEVRDQTLLADRAGKEIVILLHQPCQVPERLADRTIIDLSGRRVWWQPELRRLITAIIDTPLIANAWSLRFFELEGMMGRLAPFLGWALFLLLLGGGFLFLQTRPPPVALPSIAVPVTPVLQTYATLRPRSTSNSSLPNPEPTPVETKIRYRDGKVMVLVPEGSFLMGSRSDDLDADDDERPQQLVYLATYWIDKTEVNNSQYQLCYAQGVCSPSNEKRSMFLDGQQPVVGVTWEQAAVYCKWVGGRLPTEAEWEKAARGVDGRIFPWGDRFDSNRLNYCDRNCIADWRDFEGDDGYRYTAPVNAFVTGASPYGAQNMSGNVWEWTGDWYDPLAYQSSAIENPNGPDNGRQRVIRGGSWLYLGRNVRVTRRQKELPTYGYDNIGFRCVVPTGNLP